MQGDEVALGEQLVGRDKFHVVKRGGVVGVSEHFHAERTGDDGDCLAYLAEADYAESFAVKLGERGFLIAEIFAIAPFAAHHRVAVKRHMICVLKYQRKGELSHRRGAVGGDVANGYALLFAILPIDHVVARAQQADVAQLGQLFERFAAQGSFVCYDYLAARRPLGDKPVGGAVIY